MNQSKTVAARIMPCPCKKSMKKQNKTKLVMNHISLVQNTATAFLPSCYPEENLPVPVWPFSFLAHASPLEFRTVVFSRPRLGALDIGPVLWMFCPHGKLRYKI